MNQKVLCHFEIMNNDKYYQFSFQPGVVTFDDIDAALAAFKVEVDKLRVIAVEAEAKTKAEAEAKNECVEECPEVEAEIVA